MTLTRAALEQLASDHGFHAVRCAEAGPAPHGDALENWLDAGHHATLDWMTRTRAERGDPRRRLADAKTAIVLAVRHAHQRPPDPGGRTGMVARYAWGRDYHNLVGKRLKRLLRALRGLGIAAWGGVDTAPILERSWAAAAGMGFGGKNTLQILPADTSWFFLAVVFVDVALPPDAPLGDHCGRCTRCLTGCPTDAFVAPRVLDARRCISYWTIEARGLPPRSLRPGFGRWFFGCDACQEVCPHNAASPNPEEADLAPRHAWVHLDDVVRTPDDALMERFIGTPLRRPGAVGLKRNALLVLGNLGDDGAVPIAELAGSHEAPVVRAAAVWCLARLGAASLPAHPDPDPLVDAEWRAVAAHEVPPATAG